MSQRAVLGHSFRQPIALVRAHGERIECLGLVPWLVPQLLAFVADYWDGTCAPHSSPERLVLESLSE